MTGLMRIPAAGTTRRRLLLIAGVLILLCASLWYAVRAYGLRARDMMLPFTEVSGFAPPVLLLHGYCPKLEYVDVSWEDSSRRGVPLPGCPSEQPPYFVIPGIRPDGKRLYVAVHELMFELDHNLRPLRSIPISAFSIGDGYRFFKHLLVSHNRVCFTALRGKEVDILTLRALRLVVWDPSKKPESRTFYDINAYSDPVGIDDSTNSIILRKPTPARLNLETGEQISIGCKGFWLQADFDPDRGLLLTQSPFGERYKRARIVRVDHRTGEAMEIAQGSAAVWGSDGYVYFCRGTTRLWRCRSNGEKKELVYAAGPAPDGPLGGIRAASEGLDLLAMSTDRSLVAFRYHFGPVRKTPEQFGMVYVDLKRREFLHRPGTSRQRCTVFRGSDEVLRSPVGPWALPPEALATVVQSQRPDAGRIEYFLNRGADPNAKVAGETLLQWFIGSNPNLVELLLKHGADPNVKDEIGRTPLHTVVSMNRRREVKALLRHGADPNLRDAHGRTPLELAKSRGFKDLSALLQEHEERRN